jgi:hypothetical protein
MSLFSACISVRICILGCPASGLPALDWRRARGLPERLDNRHDVTILGEVSEEDFRRLVSAGFLASGSTDGSMTVARTALGQAYCPLTTTWHGHCALIPVAPEDDAVTLACRALRACSREQRRHDIGADQLESERAALLARCAEIEAALAAAD